MYCINCGAEIDNRSKFCPLCGTKQLKWESLVSEEETSVSEAPVEETEAQASEDITRIKKVLEDFYAGEGEETVEETAEEVPEEAAEEIPEEAAEIFEEGTLSYEDDPGELNVAPMFMGDVEDDPEEKKRSILNYVLFGLIGALILGAGIWTYIQSRRVEVNLNDYVTISYEGYDTLGTATAKFNTKQFEADFGDRIKFRGSDEERDSLEQPSKDKSDAALLIKNCIGGTLDSSSDLSNGDTVIYTWDCDDALAQDRFKVTMTYTDVEETVDDLEEVDFFDPFDFIDVTFVGKDGEAEVELVEDDDEPMVDELYYDVDPIDHLSVGDIVTITVSYLMDEESFVEEFGAIPSVTEMEYEVEDLESDDGPSISGNSSNSGSSGSSGGSTSSSGKGTVLPNSSDKLLTNSDVSGLSKADIQTAINEIYARHGYTFTNPSLLAKFKQYDWYKPTVAADRFSDSVFSTTEKKNVDFLKSKL